MVSVEGPCLGTPVMLNPDDLFVHVLAMCSTSTVSCFVLFFKWGKGNTDKGLTESWDQGQQGGHSARQAC